MSGEDDAFFVHRRLASAQRRLLVATADLATTTTALQKLHTAEAWTPQLEHYSAADEVAIVDFPKQALMLSNTYHVIDAQTGDGFIGVFWDDLVLGHTRVSRAVKHQH